MWNLFLQIISGILGLWLAQRYVPGVDFNGHFFVLPKNLEFFSEFLKSLVFAGIILGFLNHFIKPLLKKITLPLRIVTFNLFNIILAMFMVWLIDVISPELIIEGLKSVFLVTVIVLALGFALSKWMPQRPFNQ